MRRLLAPLLLTLLLSACIGLFFQPYRPYVRTPADIGLTYEDVTFETDDGVRLHGWYLPASRPSCATILFLHGNAENISTHIASVYWLPARGFNVFLFDYRGYGASSGSPSLAGIQRDIDAAMRYVLGRRDHGPAAMYGQSLGGAMAIYYAAHGRLRAHIRSLVVESSFASYRGITREKLAGFWLTWPLQWLPKLTISDKYSPVAAIGQVAPIPLLLVHGDKDPIVPLQDGERLFAAAHEPKEFWKVEGVGHIAAFRSPAMRERLTAYLRGQLCPDLPRPAAAD
jgi:uncharacterized protein